MAIDPQEIDVTTVDKLDDLNLAIGNFLAHTNLNGKLGKATINQLATFIAPYVTAIGGSGFLATTGTVLPAASAGKFTIVDAGTFTQTTGGSIVTTELLNILGSSATTWSLVEAIPLPSTIALKTDLQYKGTFDSLALALAAIPLATRKLGDTVGIKENGSVVEYWWKASVSDVGLVLKLKDVVKKNELFSDIGLNKFNPNDSIDDYRISATTGLSINESGSAMSARIKVKSDTFYKLDGRTAGTTLAFFDVNGAPLKPRDNTGAELPSYSYNSSNPIKSPLTADTFQFTWKLSGVGSSAGVNFYEGSVPKPYEAYSAKIGPEKIGELQYTKPGGSTKTAQNLSDEIQVNSTKVNALKTNFDNIFKEHGQNYINPNNVVLDKRFSVTTGLDVDAVGSAMTGVFYVEGDILFIVTGRNNTNKGIRFFDIDGVPLKPMRNSVPEAAFQVTDGVVYRTPINAVTGQLIYKNDGVGSLANVQFAQGSVVLPFEPYTPKLSLANIPELPYAKTGGSTKTIQDVSDEANTATTTANTANNTAENAKTAAENAMNTVDGKIDKTEKGSPLGVASLGEDGKILPSQIDLLGYINIGNWNASTNTPTLVNGTGVVNNYYLVSVAGTFNGLSFDKGDKVVYSSVGTWVLDKQKEVPKPISSGGLTADSNFVRVDDTLYNVYNQYTKVLEPYLKVTKFPNGLTITDDDIDGKIYKKIGSEYFGNSKFLGYNEVSIKDIGAKVDGVTNDEPVVQSLFNFFNKIGGGSAFFPAGETVFLNKGLEIFSKTSISGVGKLSQQKCIANITTHVDLHGIYNTRMTPNGSTWNPVRDFHIKDIYINCEGFGNVGTSYVGRKGIFILGMEDCSFERVTVYRSVGTGIGCDFLTRTSIKGCIIAECGRFLGDGVAPEIGQSGIGIGSCSIDDESVVVDGNWCINNGNYGIFVETQNNPSLIKSRFAKIINNHCMGNRYGIGNKGSGGTQISGNTCYYNKRHGIFLNQDTLNNSVYDNDCGYNLLSGIVSEGGENKFSDSSSSIHSNKCHHNTAYGIYLNNGEPTYNMSVSDNDCFNNGLSGILLSNYYINASLKSNKCFNNGQAGNTANCFGIYARTGIHNLIQGNFVYDNQPIKTQKKGIALFAGLTDAAIGMGTLKPTILKDNVVTGYSDTDALAMTGLIDGVDYILNGNLLLT